MSRSSCCPLNSPEIATACADSSERRKPHPLEPGQIVEREIAGGQTHAYQIALAAGQFLRVEVEEQGIDVALTLASPDGKQVAEADFAKPGTPESLSHEAVARGDYRLTLHALGSATLAGAYRLRMEARRVATEEDRKRIVAERLLGEVDKMSPRGESIVAAQEMLEKLQQALGLWRELKDRHGEAQTLLMLGVVHYRLSRYEQASEYYEQALAVRREAKDQTGEGVTLNNLALIYLALGRYDKTIGYYELALAISREAKNRSTEGNIFTNLATAYYRLGRYDKAIEYYEQGLAIKREVNDRAGEGRVLLNLGGAYDGLRRREKAIEHYERALAINRETKDRFAEGSTLAKLGNTYSGLARYGEAIECYEQALAISREVQHRWGEGVALTGLGDARSILNRSDTAIEYHEQALAIAREIKTRDSEATALYGLAKTERERGNLSRARSLHRADPTKNFDALAVEASERGRARGLLELLTEAGAGLRQGVDAELLERERTLAQQLNAKAQQLTGRNTPDEAAALNREISQIENDYEQAQAAIRKASPRYAALTQPQMLKLGEIQQQLDADTLLLEYSLGEARSFLWAVTNNSLTSYELPQEQQITQAAKQVYNLLTAHSRPQKGETPSQRLARIAQAETQLPQAARQLSQMLLGPAATQLGGKRLVIVADGAVQYLPFAMLPNPNRTTPEPLIVNHEIVTLPSASTLAVQRRELAGRQPAPKMIAVLADPVFAASDVRLKTVSAQTAAKPDAPAQTTAATLRARQTLTRRCSVRSCPS